MNYMFGTTLLDNSVMYLYNISSIGLSVSLAFKDLKTSIGTYIFIHESVDYTEIACTCCSFVFFFL